MRDLHPVIHAPDHEPFFAPVKLEGLAVGKHQGHKGERSERFIAVPTLPGPDEIGYHRVTPGVARRLDLREDKLAGAAISLDPGTVGYQRTLELLDVLRQLSCHCATTVARFLNGPRCGTLQPALDRVSGESCASRNLAVSEPIAQMHAPYPA